MGKLSCSKSCRIEYSALEKFEWIDWEFSCFDNVFNFWWNGETLPTRPLHTRCTALKDNTICVLPVIKCRKGQSSGVREMLCPEPCWRDYSVPGGSGLLPINLLASIATDLQPKIFILRHIKNLLLLSEISRPIWTCSAVQNRPALVYLLVCSVFNGRKERNERKVLRFNLQFNSWLNYYYY